MRAPPVQAARGFLLSRGNEKLTKSLNQVEGRCAQFYADELNEERPHLRAFSFAAQFFNR
jgi:hypothetical protein